MSYEKKMKKLLGRLVSMSPEPPPFPEEIPMARHETKKSPRPAIVLLGAAAVVAVLAIPVILLSGGEEPVVVATTTTMPETSTTLPAPATTTPVETTTTTPAITNWSGVVFLYQSPDNSFLGNPALVPVSLALTGGPDSDAPFTEALAAVDAEFSELSHPLANAIPASVQIVGMSTTTVDGTEVLVVDMNQAFLDGAGGLLADTTMLNQLIYTLTIGEGADEGILFTVGGEPIETFGSEGLVLTDPVDRQSFISELNPIFLTEPILELEHVYLVYGLANVFEASLMVQVLDGDDGVVHEEPVMASCGSGCWGEFGVGVGSDLITPGESSIRLLTYSAQDGSPQDSITIPIPAGGVWELSVG